MDAELMIAPIYRRLRVMIAVAVSGLEDGELGIDGSQEVDRRRGLAAVMRGQQHGGAQTLGAYAGQQFFFLRYADVARQQNRQRAGTRFERATASVGGPFAASVCSDGRMQHLERPTVPFP